MCMDKDPTCWVSRGKKKEKTNMEVILPAIDSHGDEDGVQRNEILLNCIDT